MKISSPPFFSYKNPKRNKNSGISIHEDWEGVSIFCIKSPAKKINIDGVGEIVYQYTSKTAKHLAHPYTAQRKFESSRKNSGGDERRVWV